LRCGGHLLAEHFAPEDWRSRLEITFKKFRYRLTRQRFRNYSDLMESELNALEEKIDEFVQLCQQLRSENIQLRQQLASASSENRHLAEKINNASSRLEALLARLPESEE
jgi:cell division protein ZapB